MAITLRSEKGSPLTNNEVDDNFVTLRDEKISRDGTISMTGKLTAVQPNSSRANIRLPKNDSFEPSSPVEGDLWNYGGVLKFRKDGSTTSSLVTTGDTGTVTNTMLAGSIANDKLANSSITVTGGTGVSVTGSPVSLGGSITVANSGVTSAVAGTGISVSGSTGAVTIGNTGVTAITGTSNQVVASASTGSVTLSLPQSIATTSGVTFGSMNLGSATGATTGQLKASGDIIAFASSDNRLKDNVATITDALSKVLSLRGVTYVWNETAEDMGLFGPDTGIIAQDIATVLPEVVTIRDNGFMAVKYEKMIGLLIEAIKELNAKVEKCSCNK